MAKAAQPKLRRFAVLNILPERIPPGCVCIRAVMFN